MLDEIARAALPADKIVTQLRRTLASKAYAQRLATIHRYYHNSKSEGRYRDALLELFNQSGRASRHDWRAYAEADKVDLVITQPGKGSDGWVRVEMKYQFVFDLWSRVGTTLGKLKREPDDLVRQQLLSLAKNSDLKRIVRDCIGRDMQKDSLEKKCDLFVLIVQDRFGAKRPDADESRSRHAGSRKWKCPELDERGVRLQFLHEQISLDAEHGEAYEEKWIAQTWDMLKLIHQLRGFRLRVVARKMANNVGLFPLTSYIFMLDFTAPCVLPADEAAFLKLMRAA